MKLLSLALLFISVLSQPNPSNTVLQNLQQVSELSSLYSTITSGSFPTIVALLNSSSNAITLFAPTNNALDAAGLGSASIDFVTNLLAYHTLQDKTSSIQFAALAFPRTYLQSSLYVTLDGAFQVVEVSKSGSEVSLIWGIPGVSNYTSYVTQSDIASLNGYIHIINTTLNIPQQVSSIAVAGGLTSFSNALDTAGLTSAVDTTPAITIFAPINAAFDNAIILPGTENDVLQSHVVSGVLFSKDLSNVTLDSLSGTQLDITVTSTGVFVNGAKVLLANILTKNGVVHVIDRVLATPAKTLTIAQNIALISSLSALYSVVADPRYSSISNTLSDPSASLTLFAPTTSAFNAAGVDPDAVDVVTQVLLYHVLPIRVTSSGLGALQFPATSMKNQTYVNIGANKAQVLEITKSGSGDVQIVFGIPGVLDYTANVTYANVLSSNGVIHIINTVLSFPSTVSTTAMSAGLTELVSALNTFNLTSTVDNTAAVTVFAPTNAAIDELGVANITDDVLKYHVLTNVIYSTGFNNGNVTTLQGHQLTIIVTPSGIQVQDGRGRIANVIASNVLTKNGVVHLIDKVLLVHIHHHDDDGSASHLLFSPLSLFVTFVALVSLL